MMMPRSSTSKYLIAACVCVMVALGVAKGKDKASEQCNAVLVISAVTQSSSEGNGNIHVRSLSPWTWKFSTVENRIPSTIWEAECSSSHCSSPNNPSQPGAFAINSVPIYQQVLVLSHKESCYTASYQTVAVGCTCVWAKTAIN